MSGWRGSILRLLRVPPDPDPPPGSAPRIFRAAPNYFYVKLIVWALGHIAALALIFPLVILTSIARQKNAPRFVLVLVGVLAFVGVVWIIARLTIGLGVAILDYELRWYMISDRAIRIREGVLSVREKTIALANIQNTVIRQGPLQRLLGIADVEVTTAGGGSGHAEQHGQKGSMAEPMHVGYFRGVDNAAELRRIIQEGVRRHRNTGLGDPEDAVHHDSAHELLDEVRKVREMLKASLAAS